MVLKQQKGALALRVKRGIANLLPVHARIALLVTLLWNQLIYQGTKLLAKTWPHFDLSLPLDELIPFLPWTVSIYFACFLFWAVNYILCARREKALAYRFLSADLFAKIICGVFFLLLPTTNTRPTVDDQSVWDFLMRFLYQIDSAENLFPSIHCLVSWFCYIGVRGQKDVPKWYRRFSCLMALAVFVSTLTTKQHVLPDVFAGVLLAEFSYWFVQKSGFSAAYGRCMDRLIHIWTRLIERWNARRSIKHGATTLQGANELQHRE